MATWVGPGSPFLNLFNAENGSGPQLEAGAQAVYGAWALPPIGERPHVYVNFVTSRDGRISFGIPGAMGGGAVSRSNSHDQWLMGLLRARADAVMVGDGTLKQEPEHIWTAEAIFPADAAGFGAMREAERRHAFPLQVFISATGAIPEHAAVFKAPSLRILIATTASGVDEARKRTRTLSNVEVLECGEHHVDFELLYNHLWNRHAVRTILCEGGPRLYGSLLQAGAVDEEFLTLSPLVIGNIVGPDARPGLVEGAAFSPENAPVSKLLSVRKAGDFLFLRSGYQ